MSARQYPEIIIETITNLLKDNLSSIRDGIIASVNQLYSVDNATRINISKNWKYYISETSDAFELPACYVIAGPINFTQEKEQGNYRTGTLDVKVSVVDSDETPEMATRRTYRYLSAVDEILHQKNIVSSNSGISMTILVDRSDFSPLYTQGDGHEFCKEVMIDCSVKFRQTF